MGLSWDPGTDGAPNGTRQLHLACRILGVRCLQLEGLTLRLSAGGRNASTTVLTVSMYGPSARNAGERSKNVTEGHRMGLELPKAPGPQEEGCITEARRTSTGQAAHVHSAVGMCTGMRLCLQAMYTTATAHASNVRHPLPKWHVQKVCTYRKSW